MCSVLHHLQELFRYTTQKMKFSIKDFFSKCDQIRSFRSLLGLNVLFKSSDGFCFSFRVFLSEFI